MRPLRHLRRTLITALPVLLALLVAGGWWRPAIVQKLDAFVYDARLRASMPGTLDDRIAIIDIDEPSLAEVGRWPWPRNRVAELVDELFVNQRVAVLGMDIVFAEPDESSGLKRLRSLAEGPLRHEKGFQRELARLAPELDNDQRLAQALRDRPVVLGYYFTSDRNGHRSGALPEPVLTRDSLGGQGFHATRWNGYGSNIPVLTEGAAQAGFLNAIVDSDGVVRSLPLLAEFEGGYHESLALGVFRALAGMPDVVPGFPPGDLQQQHPHLASVVLAQGDRTLAIPVDQRVATLIPFRGQGGPQGGSFAYHSAADVLRGRLPAGTLEDKIVLLGTTAPGLMDLRATPVSEVFPGVETHANLLSALLDGHLPVQPDYAMGFDLLQTLAAGLLLLALLPRLSALWSALVTAAVAAVLIGLNAWLYVSAALVLPMASVLLMVFACYAIDTAYGYFVESRSKRQLAGLFGTYVPPELVDEMVKEPERYDMRATERELTVMFSDMRGFTNLSETMSPQALQELLNRVFSRLSACIRHQRGTIDKFMGDCVMAFWGAPMETPEHARLAVLAALDMRQAIADINREHASEGLPPIGMGVGINTGHMCVGDMGSDLRRSYTVIGDAVNLGSRLEGLSKHYGVDIVVSESARAQAGDAFVWQELDRVKVKGKEEAVTIHALLGRLEDVTPAQQAELTQWHDTLQAYRRQDWIAALAGLDTLQTLAPDSTLYGLYRQRIEEWQQQPPPPGWDGSNKFDSK
ncbi:CHASE2 domain-containing protein [Hydrogenophaga aquatica]